MNKYQKVFLILCVQVSTAVLLTNYILARRVPKNRMGVSLLPRTPVKNSGEYMMKHTSGFFLDFFIETTSHTYRTCSSSCGGWKVVYTIDKMKK